MTSEQIVLLTTNFSKFQINKLHNLAIIIMAVEKLIF